MKAPLCSFWVSRISRLYSIVPALNMHQDRQDQRELHRRDAAVVAEKPGEEASHQKGSFFRAMLETWVTVPPSTCCRIGVTTPQG